MTSVLCARTTAMVATALIALTLHAVPAAAIDTPAPAPAEDKDKDKKATAPKPDPKPTSDDKAKDTKGDKKSDLQFLNGYRQAYDLVYRKHDLVAGLAALRALGRDDHSDVATMIGYASRKLGRYDEAKFWYDKALENNPRNARTLSYYGMWHAEQGNRLKAKDYLASVQAICGSTKCREYAELKSAIDGNGTY